MEKSKAERPRNGSSGSALFPSYEPLSKADVRRIVDAAFDVLARAGVAVHSPSAFEAFKAAGAPVDSETRIVRLPRGLVEDAVASNPSSVTLYSRDGEHNVVLETGSVYFGTGGTALHVLDPDTGECRRSRTEDLVLSARLVEVLEHVDLFQINLFPGEIDENEAIDVNRFFHALDNTKKHVMGGVISPVGARKVVELAEMIAGGAEPLRAKPFVSFITLLISPLKIDNESGEMTSYLARKGLPTVVPAGPVCGSTSPVTLASNVLLHTAETLAGIALVQCVNKGAPGIGGCVGSIADLKSMRHLGGAIERAMINGAMAQIARHLGLPLYASAGTSEAKEVDVQAGFETAMASLLVGMSGANYIHNAAGHMESAMTVSFEKMVVDNEIIGMFRRVLRGIKVTDETLAVDLIVGKGPGGDFMAEEHTVRHMRSEFFMPRVANRKTRDELTPGDDALGRARAFVQQVRRGPRQSLLPVAVRQRILQAFPGIRRV